MPNKQCWMLFKVANLDRLQALQGGLLYMNSVDYFAKLEGEAGAALRRDELENVYLKLSSGKREVPCQPDMTVRFWGSTTECCNSVSVSKSLEPMSFALRTT